MGICNQYPPDTKGQLYVLDCGDGDTIIDFVLPEIFETDFKNLNLLTLTGEINIMILKGIL